MIKINRRNPLFILVVVFLLLSLLHIVKVLQPVERLFFQAVKPISLDFYHWGSAISESRSEKRSRDELVIEINSLKDKVESLAIEKANLKELEEENDKLREQLEFSSRYNFKTTIANVVAKEGLFTTASRRDLIIDKGEKQGLYPGLAVLSEKGVVVGKIVEVKSDSSRVCLTTSPGCQLAVSLQNEDQTQGLTNGNLGLTISMDYIPQLEKISPGDIVISSGLSAEVPRGLVIGQVKEVISESNEVWQRAVIEPILNFNNLTLVSVVIP